MKISYSRLKAFNCPHYFYQEYLTGKKKSVGKYDPTKPLPLRIGQFCHRVAELYAKVLIQRGETSDHDLFRTILDDEWSKDHYIPSDKWEEIEQMMVIFAESMELDLDTILGAELQIALNRNMREVGWEEESAWLRLVIDLVNVDGHKAHIKDYKVTHRIPKESDIKGSLQGKIYALALNVINPNLTDFTMTYHYIRQNATRTVHYHESELVSLKKLLESFSDKIDRLMADENAYWPPIPGGDTCNICTHECPLVAQGYQIIRTEDDAKNVAHKIVRLRKEADTLMWRLRDWSSDYGPITLENGSFSWRVGDVVTIKPDQVVSFCVGNNLPMNKFLKSNTQAIRSNDGLMNIATVRKGKTTFKWVPNDQDEKEED